MCHKKPLSNLALAKNSVYKLPENHVQFNAMKS